MNKWRNYRKTKIFLDTEDIMSVFDSATSDLMAGIKAISDGQTKDANQLVLKAESKSHQINAMVGGLNKELADAKLHLLSQIADLQAAIEQAKSNIQALGKGIALRKEMEEKLHNLADEIDQIGRGVVNESFPEQQKSEELDFVTEEPKAPKVTQQEIDDTYHFLVKIGYQGKLSPDLSKEMVSEIIKKLSTHSPVSNHVGGRAKAMEVLKRLFPQYDSLFSS
jgi:hypothetical protein